MLPVAIQDFFTWGHDSVSRILLYQYLILILTAICICGCRAIQNSICYHNEGPEAACEFVDAYYMLLFGAVQIVLSQIPNFHNIEWLSVLAATMSFTYSFIGMGLSIMQTIGMHQHLLLESFIRLSMTGLCVETYLKIYIRPIIG